MLGKRLLVDYSDDDDDTHKVQTDNRKIDQDTGIGSKPRKNIPYSRVSANNAIKTLLNSASFSSGNELKREIEEVMKTSRRIEFDTVNGKKEFEIDAPREKMWKGKKEREAYYYTAMAEIYKDKLTEPEKNDQSIEPQQSEYTIEEVNGKIVQLKNISQKELINFDHQKYLEQKERKDLLLEDKVKMLNGNKLDGNHSKLTTKAYELLEKEAAQQAFGIEKEGGIKRNKKQYGF